MNPLRLEAAPHICGANFLEPSSMRSALEKARGRTTDSVSLCLIILSIFPPLSRLRLSPSVLFAYIVSSRKPLQLLLSISRPSGLEISNIVSSRKPLQLLLLQHADRIRPLDLLPFAM